MTMTPISETDRDQSTGRAHRACQVLVKPGPDGHAPGATVTRACRDAECGVLYTGRYRTPEQSVAVAIAADVPLLGLAAFGEHLETSRVRS